MTITLFNNENRESKLALEDDPIADSNLFYYLFIYGVRMEESQLWLQPFIERLYQPWIICSVDCGADSEMEG
jgi:hypothetical protein